MNNVKFSPAVLNVFLIKLMEDGRDHYQKNHEHGTPSISTLDKYRGSFCTNKEGLQLDNIKLLKQKFDSYAVEHPDLANSRHTCALAFDEKVIAPGIQSKVSKGNNKPTGMGINDSMTESIIRHKYFEEDLADEFDNKECKTYSAKIGTLFSVFNSSFIYFLINFYLNCS